MTDGGRRRGALKGAASASDKAKAPFHSLLFSAAEALLFYGKIGCKKRKIMFKAVKPAPKQLKKLNKCDILIKYRKKDIRKA